ncbi:MAG: sugar kinase [Deltaproteobacteria bacterium]|nr:sugar kinase [Deltaproteobacteria bacterium]
MSSVVAVGSMAFDTIETPFGKAQKILGGSVNHFSLAASYFVPVQCVSVVGDDFPRDHLSVLTERGIDIQGVQTAKGKTFHWSGRYGYELHEAHTLTTCLNVFESFEPTIPEEYKKTPYVFLGNISPKLQLKVLENMANPKFIALDTMNFWIEGSRKELVEILSRCNALLINEGEARQLTKTYNIVQAGQMIRSWGPQITVIKRGEYGAVLFDHGEVFSIPGLPLAEVKDPTGAGDAFAGGFIGYLASQAGFSISRYTLRKAVVYGSVMASFIVQDFGFRQLLNLKRESIEERYNRFIELTAFHVE